MALDAHDVSHELAHSGGRVEDKPEIQVDEEVVVPRVAPLSIEVERGRLLNCLRPTGLLMYLPDEFLADDVPGTGVAFAEALEVDVVMEARVSTVTLGAGIQMCEVRC